MQEHRDSGGRRGHDQHEVDVSDENRRYSIQKTCIIEKEPDEMFCPYIKYLCDPSYSDKENSILLGLILFTDIQRCSKRCLRKEWTNNHVRKKDKGRLHHIRNIIFYHLLICIVHVKPLEGQQPSKIYVFFYKVI